MEEHLTANQNLTDSVEKLKKKTEQSNKILEELRLSSRDFFLKLALLSGGIISLSVTFIGYLASIEGFELKYPEMLFASWLLLVLSLVGGVYRNFFYDKFGHYQVQRERVNAILEMKRAEVHLLEKFPQSFINVAPSELNDMIKDERSEISKIQTVNKENWRQEKRNEFIWTWSERITNLGFVLGVILIALFASVNLPVNFGQSLIFK